MGKKYKVVVIYGKSVSRHALDYGFKATKRKILTHDIEGDVKTYEFDTENDARMVDTILGDYDGWIGFYVNDGT